MAIPAFSQAALKAGDPAPDLSTFNLEGQLPEKLRGQVILLDFWASWCTPCKASFPAMEDLHKQWGGQGLVIVAVNVDAKRDDMERFLKKFHISFCVVRDAKQKLVATADVPTMPTSFLIDRTGKVRFRHDGFVGQETIKQYQDEIQRLLKEPAP